MQAEKEAKRMEAEKAKQGLVSPFIALLSTISTARSLTTICVGLLACLSLCLSCLSVSVSVCPSAAGWRGGRVGWRISEEVSLGTVGAVQ